RRRRHVEWQTDDAVDHKSMPLIHSGKAAISAEVELIGGFKIGDDIRDVVDRFRKRVRNLELILPAISLRRRQRQSVIRRAARRLHLVVLKNPCVNRTKSRTVDIYARLS